MTETKKIPPSPSRVKTAKIDAEGYQEMYQRSINDPEGFWGDMARTHLDWIKPFETIENTSYDAKNLKIKWFEDGTLNASANCLDRHLATRGDQTALIFEGDDPKISRHITYRALHQDVCRLANVLKKHGVQPGDRITIYMPMIVEAVVAMLAVVRIGAVHSVVFGGFSPDALAGRINDCQSTFLITADEGIRGGKTIPLKTNADKALTQCPDCNRVIVVKRSGGNIDWVEGRDFWYADEMAEASPDCPPRRGRCRRTRCSSSTRQVPPANPKASSTPPAAICSMPASPSNMFLTTMTAISIGAPPMSVG